MKYLNKFDVDFCVICILFFPDKRCHVALTSQSNPEKYVATLTRTFKLKNLEPIATESFSIGNLNYWDRVSDKYMWRYLMHYAGFQIVNQDGSVFENVESETNNGPKLVALQKYAALMVKPAIAIVYAECKRRHKKFLPKQVIRKTITNSNNEQRRYSFYEQKLFDSDSMQPELCNSVNFTNGKVGFKYQSYRSKPENSAQ